MPQLETIGPSRAPLWRRMWDGVRSSWSGPLTSSSPELSRYFNDAPSSTGLSVSADTALTYPAFWAAVSLIAADIASFPLILYKRESNGGKTRFIDHQLYRLLHDEPNREMSAFVFRETLQAHVLVWGNAYAEIERDQLGRVAALWPLLPTAVQPFRPRTDPYGPLRYAVANPDGTTTELGASDVLHVPGLGFDGYMGYSVVGKARESLGLGLAMQRFGAKFFANGTRLSGVFTTTAPLGPGKKESVVAELRKFHEGVDNSHRFALLEGGMDFKQLGVPPDDAQFLESRAFHIQEIARWFRLSPHKLADLSRATFSNIEHLGIDHVVGCLRTWCIRWEQEINRKLIAPSERRIQFVEHLVDGLLRGDLQSRYAAYQIGRQGGWLSADDIREKENMNPLPNGQGRLYWVPQNMWPADRVDEMIAAQAAKAKPAPAAPDTNSASETLTRQLEMMTGRAQVAEMAASEIRERVSVADAVLAERTAQLGAADARTLEAKAECEALRGQLIGVELQRDEMTAECGRLKAEIEALTVTREQDRAVLEEAQASRQIAEADRVAAQAERDAAIAAREAAEMSHVEAVRLAADAEQRANELAASVESMQTTSSEERRRHETATMEMDALRLSAAALQAKADQAASDLQAVIAREAAAQEALRTLERESQTRADDLQQTITGLQNQVAVLDVAKAGDVATVDALRVAIAALERERDQARTGADTEREVVEVERAARADAERRLQERDAVERERVAQILAAHRALIVDVMRRMIDREIDRARRAQTTPEKLRHWIDTFYPGHEELCVAALLPAIRVHTSWAGRHEDPDVLTRVLVRQHIEDSKRQISAVADGDADELAGSLYQLCERWQRDRVTSLADVMLQKEIDRVLTAI